MAGRLWWLWLTVAAMLLSGMVAAAPEKSLSREQELSRKIIETQQKNREIMQKTVDDVLNLVPGGEQRQPEKKPPARAPEQPATAKIAPAVAPPRQQLAALTQPASSPGRDPFTTSPLMYQEMGQQSATGAGRGFVPSLGMDNVPKMQLKGILNNNLKQGATALLEVEGAGVFLVRSGDEIGLQAIGRNQVLKVIKVDALKVEVQAGQINQVIIVR